MVPSFEIKNVISYLNAKPLTNVNFFVAEFFLGKLFLIAEIMSYEVFFLIGF